MIHFLSLFKLKSDTSEEELEALMVKTRSTLLHIRETLHLSVGKKIDPQEKWDWFLSIETESLDKLKILKDDPHFYKFQAEVISPYITESESHIFEMTPRKNVQFS